MIDSALTYFNDHFEEYVNDLRRCLTYPSISTIQSHHQDINDCAQYVAEHMNDIGLNNIHVFTDYGHPIVYGEYMVDASKPTLLFYGHYDVQPVDPVDLWNTPPFEPQLIDGYIVARGASDNKGMFYAQLKAVESYLKSSKSLPVNVKFVIEGEEEIGSHGLTTFIKDHQTLLTYDALVVSDSPMFSESQPSICLSLRGLIYLECHVKSINYDVHSGQLGGGVPNVIDYVSSCIHSMKDPISNRVLIPGFYDDVTQFGSFDSSSSLARQHLNNLDSFYNLGRHHRPDFFQKIWYEPTLDCNGIKSGFIEDGAKTVIPNQAMFKLSCRLVHNQDPDTIVSLVKDYISSFFPDSFDVDIKSLGPYARPLLIEESDPFVQKAINALSDTHQMPIVIQGEGGSIPILAEFQQLFKKPLVLIGLNSPNDNIHAPNERFKLSHFKHGVELYIRYMNQF